MIYLKLDATDSTNSYLKDLIRNGDPVNWTVVSTSEQRQGRGQQGASWFSSRDKNLTLSILIRDTGLKASDQFLLNCAVSNGIHRVLEKHGIPRLKVKWPNDIMSGALKLAGILIENSLMHDRISHSIVGIGLNVNQDHFPLDLPQAVSMRQLTGKEFDLELILAELVESIKDQVALIESKQYDTLRRDYSKNMFRREIPHMFRVPGGASFIAKIEGTTDQGLLILRKEDESLSYFAFKEVEYL